jgi:hypothetical protein
LGVGGEDREMISRCGARTRACRVETRLDACRRRQRGDRSLGVGGEDREMISRCGARTRACRVETCLDACRPRRACRRSQIHAGLLEPLDQRQSSIFATSPAFTGFHSMYRWILPSS